jgi:hypothetical protein
MFKRGIMIFSLGMALAMPWQHARAQATGDTDISIDFPNIVILYFIDTLTLTFDAGTITPESTVDEGPSSPVAAGIDDATATFDLGVTGAGVNPLPASVPVLLENAWAVRGISTTGTIDVDISIQNATATNGSSTATMSSPTVTGGGQGPSASITIPAPGFGTPTVGDVNFSLDVSNITTAQTHTGMIYRIEAMATP